jgi:hypothetical protein
MFLGDLCCWFPDNTLSRTGVFPSEKTGKPPIDYLIEKAYGRHMFLINVRKWITKRLKCLVSYQ